MRNGTRAGALSLLFYLGLALLCSHEIDAAVRAEWRLLPGLSQLEDAAGYAWFVLLHIPLFTLVFWLSQHPDQRLRTRSRSVICGFLVVHAGLHFWLSEHPDYAFTPPIETLTVYGGAGVGLLYLALAWRRHQRQNSDL